MTGYKFKGSVAFEIVLNLTCIDFEMLFKNYYLHRPREGNKKGSKGYDNLPGKGKYRIDCSGRLGDGGNWSKRHHVGSGGGMGGESTGRND